jgi:hypothetical protein
MSNKPGYDDGIHFSYPILISIHKAIAGGEQNHRFLIAPSAPQPCNTLNYY